jgi:hypothetical protein
MRALARSHQQDERAQLAHHAVEFHQRAAATFSDN